MYEIDLYETEMPGIYVTEDGYFVDEYGDVYNEDGDLIRENFVMYEDDSNAALAATGAATLGAGAGLASNMAYKNRRIIQGLGSATKTGFDVGYGVAKSAGKGNLNAISNGVTTAKNALGANIKFGNVNNTVKNVWSHMNKGKTAAIGAGLAGAAYGAHKLYNHFKGNNTPRPNTPPQSME